MADNTAAEAARSFDSPQMRVGRQLAGHQSTAQFPDEEDCPRLKLHVPAVAEVRDGLPNSSFPLKFVRLEPYIVPKVSLTGINVEPVDTRVAQVIFAVDSETPLVQEHRLLIGRLLDVLIDVGGERLPTRLATERSLQVLIGVAPAVTILHVQKSGSASNREVAVDTRWPSRSTIFRVRAYSGR